MTVSKSEITTFLKGIYPFRNLPLPELEDLVEHVERKNLTKKETLFEIGQKADKLVIPFTCQIRLERLNQNNQYETFSILDPGEFLGLESIYQDQLYETRAICHSTGTVLIL
ncbi:MAG: cyclic nucleotide-binding domain-containing protein, partial [Anaerolineaceae bacterium]|nr:cyclic nucleotide-binding domain-containing protein [Anaerolineaceae bacterium]